MNVLFVNTLCIVFNQCEGITSVDKFDKLERVMQKADVILLQETFWKDEMMDSFKKKDGKEKCNYNNGEGGKGEKELLFM